MRRALSRPWIFGALLGLPVSGCGDDSKPIHEQWPDYTAGQSGLTQQSSGTTSATTTQSPDQTSGTTSDALTSGTQSSSGLESLPGGTQAPGICTPDKFRCVTPVPNGWYGPVARRGLSANGLVGGCEGEYRYPINATAPFLGAPAFEPALCSPCSCGRPQGVTCSDLVNTPYFQEPGCNAANLLLTVPKILADGSCIVVSNAVGGVKSLNLETPTVDASKSFCSATGAFVTKAPARWQQQERWCRARVADRLVCSDASKLCVPKIEAGFEPGVCIFQEGEHACPAGEYANRVLLHRGEQDERGCSACTCGSVTGDLACTGFLRQFSNDRCSDGATQRVESSRIESGQPSICRNLSNFSDSAPRSLLLELSVGGLDTASCAPAGGAPVGQVRGKDPVTLCCTAP